MQSNPPHAPPAPPPAPPSKDRLAFEAETRIAPSGFREYDARWLFPQDINLRGAHQLGLGLGHFLNEMDKKDVVVGHDFRSYSRDIQHALILGLMEAGQHVRDIGLALSPTAYFAQFELNISAVAMVTASHNENGWTGVKMGAARPLTFGVEDMARLKKIILTGEAQARAGGAYQFIPDMAERYKADLSKRDKLTRPLKAVVACGNGTAGIFAPDILSAVGVEVIPLHCELDASFPHHNPNPEDMAMLSALREAVLLHKADIGFAFDGDGDRCGVVDNEGAEIFADKMGVLLARHLARLHKDAHFIADVKSTGLFMNDAELATLGARTDYWKTGHSYMKQRTYESGALAGFEKSGHYFFSPPLGRGYDDGMLAALLICEMLDAVPQQSLAELHRTLPQVWNSPTMAPYCPDEDKYQIVETLTASIQKLYKAGGTFIGQKIRDVITVNGVRIVLDDGTWGLVRASSNKPSLVVVVESPISEKNMRAMFVALDEMLSGFPQIGDYDQKL